MTKSKRLPYVDCECKIGERVMWRNMKGETFEGVIKDWDNSTAIIVMDDGETTAIAC